MKKYRLKSKGHRLNWEPFNKVSDSPMPIKKTKYMKKAEVTFNKLGFKTHVMDMELAPYKTKEQLLIECESQKKALYIHLLFGGKLSIKNAYSLFGISNISREIRRQIEKPLDIELKRVKKVGKTRYKKPCYWFEYSATPLNKIALKKALEVNISKQI